MTEWLTVFIFFSNQYFRCVEKDSEFYFIDEISTPSTIYLNLYRVKINGSSFAAPEKRVLQSVNKSCLPWIRKNNIAL
ncbi:hypothetical protein SAMN04488109_6237 [Chryseolinea serpens]|uniref:Uncharacterized protein n=1 Tax=Chryseolinea serpens TaxID=947013 RepID=A0A1M5X2I6_9BACT|nr:hypothetical protein SAMN04488109_6237 [Chryseolinea serpens]